MGHSEAYERMLRAAKAGKAEALYDLGVAYAVGQNGLPIDLVSAHKWFNLAARAGDNRAPQDRAELAAEMSAFEIAEAQKQARAWLTAN
jgi:hypothetical protein